MLRGEERQRGNVRTTLRRAKPTDKQNRPTVLSRQLCRALLFTL